MVRVILILTSIILFSVTLHAQTLVSTEPRARVVVLEEFTGIHCGYCPDGHRIASALKDKYNGEPVLINIHSGGYAQPAAGEPDFRTVFGDSLDRQSGLNGYPAGTVNRHIYTSMSSTHAMGRSLWDAAAVELMAMQSPVNVGLHSEFNETSRELTVEVEAFYTASTVEATNMLNVVLLENDVISVQSDYTNGTQQNYHHKHMLRWMLSGQWGDVISTTSKGTLVKRTYKYTVPLAFKIENCEVAAFVAVDHQEIYSGASVEALGGTTQIVSEVTYKGAIALTVPSATPKSFTPTITNKVGKDESFVFELLSSMPADWKSGITIDGADYNGAEIKLSPEAAAALKVNIAPGTTSGVAKVQLLVHAKNYPKSPQVKSTYYLMSGVESLLMSHPDAVKYDSVYTRSMSTGAVANSGIMDRNVFEIFSDANALSGLKNVYYNVSWAFPGITIKSMAALKNLLDAGTNLFVAGQDFGWDLASPDTNANGNAATKEFYNKYIMADFVADGAATNNKFTPVSNDQLFKTVTTSTITATYGASYLFPDEFKVRSGASPIFYYNGSASKIGGLRAEKSYKLVYLGVGLEQLTPTTGNQIVSQVKRWFNNEIQTSVFDELIASGSSVFPNPAQSDVQVLLPEGMKNGFVQLVDVCGRVILESAVRDVSSITLSIDNVHNGTYRLLCVDSQMKTLLSNTLTVLH